MFRCGREQGKELKGYLERSAILRRSLTKIVDYAVEESGEPGISFSSLLYTTSTAPNWPNRQDIVWVPTLSVPG